MRREAASVPGRTRPLGRLPPRGRAGAMTPLLEVSDVRVRFPAAGRLAATLSGGPREIEAVAGVSFEMAPGETYALVGESGSGKTTLARAVNGLVRIAQGEVRFEGKRISGLTERRLGPL